MKVDIFESSGASRVHSIPFYLQRISAGFPSPAQGYEKQELNLHEYCDWIEDSFSLFYFLNLFFIKNIIFYCSNIDF